ncbi:2Fe-2S iron-sulfur cluster binding domain-containing protein [Novosphingobium sp.]|uniref:2Fe-2S iron-sulfur cluster binding domain-containing protein n=1 Tax=Novosphingobium sp. TaxID=1874826 RepID=UPI0033400562
MHRVTLVFSDGVEHELAVDPGASVLGAGLAAGLPLLHQCRSGSCSTCVASLVEGEVGTLPGCGSSLLASERAAGKRLLCVTGASSDCRFALPYDSKAGANPVVKGHAFVNAATQVAADVMRLELELAEDCWFTFRPGQFIQITVPGTDQTRSYSIASTPAELPKIELLIRLLPGGVMSEWLLGQVAADAVLEISGPYGAFFLQDGNRAPVVMIAGGTGLAPMMAMIDVIRARPGRKPPIHLSFGCQTAEGLFHGDALDLRRLWLPGLSVTTSVDRGPTPDGVRVGNPVEVIGADGPLDPATVAYLCGPPGMIDAARRHLQALGLADSNIHAEQFVAS